MKERWYYFKFVWYTFVRNLYFYAEERIRDLMYKDPDNIQKEKFDKLKKKYDRYHKLFRRYNTRSRIAQKRYYDICCPSQKLHVVL